MTRPQNKAEIIKIQASKNPQVITVKDVMEEFWRIVNEEERGVRISEIAHALNCTKPTVERRLKDAVREGHITRKEREEKIDTRPCRTEYTVPQDRQNKIIKELSEFHSSKRRTISIEEYYAHSKFSEKDINATMLKLDLKDRYFFFNDSLVLSKKKKPVVRYSPSGKLLPIKEVSVDKVKPKALELKDPRLQNFLKHFATGCTANKVYDLYSGAE